MPGRGPASISRTRPWAVRWSASAVSSAASRPSRFISYTVKMTRQCGAWALTSCAVRAPPRTGPSADAGADLLVEDLVPRDAVARKASSWESSSCPRAEQRVRVVPSLTPASAPALVNVTDSWQAEPSTVRARVELVHGQRRMHRAWRHGEGQSGPAYPDDLWGGVSSQPCVSWRRARRTSLDVGRCPTCRPGLYGRETVKLLLGLGSRPESACLEIHTSVGRTTSLPPSWSAPAYHQKPGSSARQAIHDRPRAPARHPCRVGAALAAHTLRLSESRTH